MTVEFVLPDVGEGLTEAEVVRWLVEPGDPIAEDQPVVEVETDKAIVEVPAPVTGTVQELHAEAGDVVAVSDVLVTFATDGGDADAAEVDEAVTATSDDTRENGGRGTATNGRTFAPPRVRRLARELGVDLGSVAGSDAGGRVTEGDVRAAADDADDGDTDAAQGTAGREPSDDGAAVESIPATTAGQSSATGSQPASGTAPTDRERTLAVPATRGQAYELDVDLNRVPAVEKQNGEAFVTAEAVREFAAGDGAAQASEGDAGAAASGSAFATAGGSAAAPSPDEGPAAGDRVLYEGVRRTIGERMERSKFTVPHVTHHDEVDVTELVATRKRLRERATERGVDLTYMPLILKAVAVALREFPRFNARLDEEAEEIVLLDEYNIGVATATDAGLMVPVVEAVDEKSVLEVAERTNELVEKARDRTIGHDELQGGTFTVTNFGAVGGEYGTPIVNYPETAILGLGTIKKKPRVVETDGAADGNGVSGEVVPRHVLTLSLSFDHRVADGADAARFVNAVKAYLRDPNLLLLE
ncbi:dihydrolipoamide acetyltransferase family protein [Natrinema gelatinilyticum]|uniref:dihydrolipoamide acetyltransferase family protein n=1 Tax=Natrinema gelatinilyticum TaxID=2961571 RepID=UPI0020C2807D|nr:dihydrolipoamide acetyltransferase family protein [Natrinema gelatinilyticum]